MSPRVLRLTTDSSFISARVFEESFAGGLDRYLVIRSGSLTVFLDDVLGSQTQPTSITAAGLTLRSRTADVDFLSVDYQGFLVLPRLAWLRNRSGAPVRLLAIAHAPGAYALDWALLRPLLRPGDRIVAPTESARTVIETLCPDLVHFVRVVPHPIAPVGPVLPPGRRLLFLGRLVREKAVHRLFDAHAKLRQRGHDLSLDIAGPLTVPDGNETTAYVRSLRARATRLGLDDRVRFLGLVQGARKAQLFADTRLVVNPSVSLEESFGKTVAEALGHGIPAVVTAWDGLPEVAGDPGTVAPVEERLFAMDVNSDVLADAIETALDRPAGPDSCRESARRFHPDSVGPRYARMLAEALAEYWSQKPATNDGPTEQEPAAPERGLLSNVAPLTAYTWNDLFQAVVEESERWRGILAGAPETPLGEAGHVRTRVLYALRRPLERILAGLPVEPVTQDNGERRVAVQPPAAFLDRIEVATLDRGASRASRVVCLDLLWAEGRAAAVQKGFQALRSQGAASAGLEYLEIEALAGGGSTEAAFARAVTVDTDGSWDEHAAHRLRQVARLALASGCPERALQPLRAWTERYPDEPDSGEVWLARAICAAGAEHVPEAAQSLERARALLGSTERVLVVAGLIKRELNSQ